MSPEKCTGKKFDLDLFSRSQESIKLFFVSGANLLDYQQWPFKIAYIVCPHVLDVPFEGFIDLRPLTYFFGRSLEK